MPKNKISKYLNLKSFVLIVVVLITIAALIYTLPNLPKEAENTAQKQIVLNEGEKLSTLKNIIAKGESLECGWRSDNDSIKGNLQTSSNRGFSTISLKMSGIPINGKAIYKGDNVYAWVKTFGNKLGFKFKETDLANIKGANPEQKILMDQLQGELIFKCEPWEADQSVFEVPTDVEFK